MLSYLMGLVAIPVVSKIKASFILGRKLYTIIICGVVVMLIVILLLFGLVAIDKAWIQKKYFLLWIVSWQVL